MKKQIVILLIFLSFGVSQSFSQCSGGSLFSSLTLLSSCVNVPTSTISTTNWFGDYNVINNLGVGGSLTLTVTNGGCITVHSGSASGPVIVFGTSTVTFTVTTSTVYIVYRANCSGCATSSVNQTTTMAFTAPTALTPQDCEGATQICNSSSFSANSSGNCHQELTAPTSLQSFNGSCFSNALNPTTIGSATWNSQLAIQKANCEAIYGAGNCIMNGGGGLGCGGGQSRYQYQFWINPVGSNAGCLAGGEHQSSWYYLNISGAGPLTMNIASTSSADDYDFAIWGPYNASTAGANCPPIQAPIRCSWDATAGVTGLATGQTDFSEGAFGGNSIVAPIAANVGDVYILLVDNFSSSGQPYGITWGGTATLGCTIINLGLEVIDFRAQNIGSKNVLNWETASEKNIDYFEIEKSTDGMSWTPVGTIKAENKTSIDTKYRMYDERFELTLNYYRLNEVDFDAKKINVQTLTINNSLDSKTLSKIINTIGQEVNSEYKGVVFYIFTDGTTFKTLQ